MLRMFVWRFIHLTHENGLKIQIFISHIIFFHEFNVIFISIFTNSFIINTNGFPQFSLTQTIFIQNHVIYMLDKSWLYKCWNKNVPRNFVTFMCPTNIVLVVIPPYYFVIKFTKFNKKHSIFSAFYISLNKINVFFWI